MSDIKFRAWDSVKERIMPVEAIDFGEKNVSIDEGDNSITDTFEMFELMQYTGRNDKNGKETYTGDIVKLTLRSGTELIAIITSGNGAYFADNYPLCSNVINHWEVLGNIYENPDLLSAVR